MTLVIIVLQPFMQFITLYYDRGYNGDRCVLPTPQLKVYLIFVIVVVVLIPFAVILIFNLATLATLIRRRFRRRAAVIDRQDHVSVFTKLTLLSGVAFILSFTLHSVIVMDMSFELGISHNTLNLLYPPAAVMFYFNNVINPVICFIVCKSARDDIKQFISVFARMIRRCFIRERSQQDTLTSNEDSGTRAVENIELTSRSAGTGSLSNVATTTV